MYFNQISIFELKIARPSLGLSFMVYEWSLADGDLNTQFFTRVELFMRSGMVTVAHLVIKFNFSSAQAVTTIVLSVECFLSLSALCFQAFLREYLWLHTMLLSAPCSLSIACCSQHATRMLSAYCSQLLALSYIISGLSMSLLAQ